MSWPRHRVMLRMHRQSEGCTVSHQQVSLICRSWACIIERRIRQRDCLYVPGVHVTVCYMIWPDLCHVTSYSQFSSPALPATLRICLSPTTAASIDRIANSPRRIEMDRNDRVVCRWDSTIQVDLMLHSSSSSSFPLPFCPSMRV